MPFKAGKLYKAIGINYNTVSIKRLFDFPDEGDIIMVLKENGDPYENCIYIWNGKIEAHKGFYFERFIWKEL